MHILLILFVVWFIWSFIAALIRQNRESNMMLTTLKSILYMIAIGLITDLSVYAQSYPEYHYEEERSAFPLDLKRPFTCSTERTATVSFSDNRPWDRDPRNISYKEDVDIHKESKPVFWRIMVKGEKAHVESAGGAAVLFSENEYDVIPTGTESSLLLVHTSLDGRVESITVNARRRTFIYCVSGSESLVYLNLARLWWGICTP